MFDGVGWAAGEIVVFMLIATLIGFAIGWIFGRWLQKGTLAESYEAELSEQRELTKKAENRLSESNKNLDKVHLDLKGERARTVDLTAEVEVAKAAAGDMEANLGEGGRKDAEIDRLTAELAAKGDLEAKLSAAGDLDAAVAKLTDDLAACATERDGLTDRVALLQGDVVSRDEEIGRLEAKLNAVPAPAIEPTAFVEPEPVVAPVPAVQPVVTEPTKDEGLARIAEIAQRTAGEGPAADDDLKKVHGIGPKLEQTLKGLGISSFRQIANFQAEDIVFVTAALDAFKGRIERDDWMSSAAAEHMKKYNEPA